MTPSQIIKDFKKAYAKAKIEGLDLYYRADVNAIFDSLGWKTTWEGNTCVGVAFIEDTFVFKLVNCNDGFLRYAEAIRNKKISSKFYLKIHKIVEFEGIFIVVSEYCPTVCNWKEADSLNGCSKTTTFFSKPVHKALDRIFENVRGCSDLHSGNIRKRSDGTLVFIDPLC